MLEKRLQILVTTQQRRRLESEAKRRGVSIGALIREALDARYESVTREDRLGAIDQIRKLSGGRFLTPAEIEAVVAEEREAAARSIPGAS
jgi:hypothetical protein